MSPRGFTFREFYIPDQMADGIERWITHAIPPGGFLAAVIANDLKEAVGRADEENLRNLPAYVAYFYNYAPRGCWGSPEVLTTWRGTMANEESA